MRPDFPLRDVELLPPIAAPEKILCIGINYANRNADYGDQEPPKYPSMFYRPPNSLVGHEHELIIPHEFFEQLDYEGEIALVIGRAVDASRAKTRSRMLLASRYATKAPSATGFATANSMSRKARTGMRRAASVRGSPLRMQST